MLSNTDYLNISFFIMKFNKKNTQIPKYLEKIIKLFPHISAGRKNYKDQHIRILKNIDIVKKFMKKNKNN